MTKPSTRSKQSSTLVRASLEANMEAAAAALAGSASMAIVLTLGRPLKARRWREPQEPHPATPITIFVEPMATPARPFRRRTSADTAVAASRDATALVRHGEVVRSIPERGLLSVVQE